MFVQQRRPCHFWKQCLGTPACTSEQGPRHGMLIPHTRPLSLLFRRKITRIYHTTLLQRIMNSSVNKWQVLHFLLLSIMYTSLYFCSIQQVLNANGLKNPFADLQPLIKKNSQEHNSKAARLFQDLYWAGLEKSLPSACWWDGSPLNLGHSHLFMVQ